MEHGFTFGNPAWLAVLHALCAVAEGADVPAHAAVPGRAGASAVVAAALRRLSVMGGRAGMPRSLGSVLGSVVIRFVGGFRGQKRRIIPTPGLFSTCNGVAVTRDGCMLLVSDLIHSCIQVFFVHNGAHVRTIGSRGDGQLQFSPPRQIWVASDDHIFVADRCRIQVLTPGFDFSSFIGVGLIGGVPTGVCADDHHVIVTEVGAFPSVSVFRRSDGARLQRIKFSGDGQQLKDPNAVCLLSRGNRQRARVCVHRGRRVCAPCGRRPP
jgi:hypothetical protein